MNSNPLLLDLQKNIMAVTLKKGVEHVGRVQSLSDGTAKIEGLQSVAAGELVEFSNGILGLTLNLEEESVGVIVLGDYLTLKEGSTVKSTGRLLSIPVGNSLLGRVINPLGVALDGKTKINEKTLMLLEKVAPGVTEREPVNTPLQTGIKSIDAMIPVGRGQRELLIGDRGTGKTAIVLDTIINQTKSKSGVICIYVAIGQKTSRVAQVVSVLEKYGALSNTVIVSADSSTPASLQFLSPYAGCAIGEYFMSQGKDAVIFYDDLTKHAWAYREVSLILRRPSGREAYPGDIFYLHSRLLERACRLNKESGSGSLTAFPIIETQAGDMSAYIPTNVISITDGQIYLESDLFYSGIRPAINVGSSVSRVGGSAQLSAMKKVAGRLRLDLAQYRELSAFVQFASELDVKTRERIDQGSRMVELLKQGQFNPVPVEEQVAVIWAGVNNKLNSVDVADVARFETEFIQYLKDHGKNVLDDIKKEKSLSESIIKKLEKAAQNFFEIWQPSNQSKSE